MFIADKRFILLLLVALILGEIGWTYFHLGTQPSFWWFDNLLHFLGGAMVAGVIVNLRSWNEFLSSGTLGMRVISLAALVILVGLGWEFYEYAADYFFNQYLGKFLLGLTVLDTLSDLTFDLLGGGAAAAFYFSSKLYKESSFKI